MKNEKITRILSLLWSYTIPSKFIILILKIKKPSISQNYLKPNDLTMTLGSRMCIKIDKIFEKTLNENRRSQGRVSGRSKNCAKKWLRITFYYETYYHCSCKDRDIQWTFKFRSRDLQFKPMLSRWFMLPI